MWAHDCLGDERKNVNETPLWHSRVRSSRHPGTMLFPYSVRAKKPCWASICLFSPSLSLSLCLMFVMRVLETDPYLGQGSWVLGQVWDLAVRDQLDSYILMEVYFQRKNDLEGPRELALCEQQGSLKGKVLAELGCWRQELRTVAEGWLDTVISGIPFMARFVIFWLIKC